MCIGIPTTFNNTASKEKITNDKIKILHAPSKAGPKGSSIFRKIINELIDEKYPIEYKEVSNVPNSEVLKLISECDFVLDELYSDTPMAVFASEAASLGKPAVVGGYYSKIMTHDIPSRYLPPSCFVLPENIKEAIVRLITDKEYRINLGINAKRFVTENWAAEKVAQKYMDIIAGITPGDWFYDPYNIDYLYGVGLSEENAKKNIRVVLNKGGIEYVCRTAKPEHEKKMKEFAYE